MEIQDYIVLSKTAGTAYNGGFKFQIPLNWYSNQRSSVATVELVQFYHKKGSGHDMAYITTNLTAQNQYVASGMQGKNILAVLMNNKNSNSQYLLEQMKLLTTARPTEIELQFYDVDGATKSSPDEFVATLKFSYYSPEETAEKLTNQFTPALRNL